MPDATPARILVVDDTIGTRYSLVRMLQKARYEVREATTGKEALRLAAERPDLIILDINLPDVDGYEVCRQVKSDPVDVVDTRHAHVGDLCGHREPRHGPRTRRRRLPDLADRTAGADRAHRGAVAHEARRARGPRQGGAACGSPYRASPRP